MAAMTREQKYPDTRTFHFHNANPKHRATGDCVVRAVSVATGLGWDDTLMALTEVSLKLKVMPNSKDCFGKYLQGLGWVKHAQPKKPDGKKYTGEEFCKMLEHGHKPIIANIGGHHTVCIKDGKVWDIWNSTDGCIGNYWQLP